ncbi:Tyrosyl-DNA phosphodiesterase 1 [Nakaseomyces bracarensis]|uniref:Tyrosyl-DNA phosphodiesterase 1 n=1 Tax=Nakaseomyces bracarensis TaxID=273131 RepID=A0ABR4NMP6_9SACH
MKRERSEAAERVAAKWRKTDYNKPEDVVILDTVVIDDSDEEETDIEDHKTITNPSVKVNEDVNASANASASAKTELKTKTMTMTKTKTERAQDVGFRLMRSEVYDENTDESPYMLDGLESIFGDPELKHCFLFSFQYDLGFLVRQFSSSVERITIIAQEGTIVPVASSDITSDPTFSNVFHKLVVKEIYMPPYSCHHSKMILNLYRNGTMKIFLPSNNFTWAETNWPQQVCWSSGVLQPLNKAPNDSQNIFQQNLVRYLKFYKLKELNDLIQQVIAKIDFRPLDGIEFIFSVPERREQELRTGVSMLLDALEETEKQIPLSKDVTNLFVCQSSTIGGPVSRKKECPSNLFTHIIVPFAKGFLNDKELRNCTTDILKQKYIDNNTLPMIIYPCMNEIRDASVGINSAGWFNFNYTKNDIQQRQYDMLRNELNVFYGYNRSYLSKQRVTTPSHSKFYFRTRIPFQDINHRKDVLLPNQLDWCLFTSANLSTNAWGTLGAKPRNYEVGVLYKNAFLSQPIEKSDLHLESLQYLIYRQKSTARTDLTKTIGVPFPLHLSPYSSTDESFYQH